MGKIDVREEDGMLVVTLSGPLSVPIVEGMRSALLRLLEGREGVLILYDSRDVELIGDDAITRRLQAVNEEIAARVSRIASVTSDYTVATRVGQIHVYSKDHERFYDLDSAKRWLRMD
jgi:hypothetical protein